MAVQFEDILNTLCSRVEPSHSTDFQTIYILGDTKEAKLAFEVLVSYGFDAKVYHEDTGSKLYITTPAPETQAQTEQKLTAALAYARYLKPIKSTLDALCADEAETLASPDYNIAFANTPVAGSKQISVQITPAAVTAAMQPTYQQAAAPQAPRPAAQAAKKAPAAKQPVGKNQYKKSDPDAFSQTSGGPAVGKKAYPTTAGIKNEEDSELRQMWLYFTGNIATSSFSVFIIIIIIVVIITLFVMSKSFLCPDFARQEKNTAWYCLTDEDKENIKKGKSNVIVPPPP